MRRHLFVAALSFALCVIGALHADPSWAHDHGRHLVRVYKATLLQDPNTSTPFVGRDLNNRGEATGWIHTDDGLYGPNNHAAVWRRGQVTLLPEANGGALSSGGAAINDHGDVAGDDQETTVGWGAFWHDGTIRRIGSIEEEFNSTPTAINNRAQVTVIEFLNRAFVWNSTGGFGFDEELAPAPGGDNPIPEDLNDAGHVAGWDNIGFFTPHPIHRAALWREGTVELLGLLPGMTDSQAKGLNELDRVVGVSSNGDTGLQRAFLWRYGQLRALPFVHRAAGESSVALAINNWGQIVGSETALNAPSRAVLWERGRAFDLNALVRSADQLKPHVTLRSARRINQWGQILVSAQDDRLGDAELSYLLTPVLEWR